MIRLYLDHVVTDEVFAGMSVAASLLTAFCLALMSCVCWHNRARFSRWRSLGSHARADFWLNWGLLLFFLHALFQRGSAAYEYLIGDWHAAGSPRAAWLVPIYLVIMIAGAGGVMRWLLFNTVGSRKGALWWWRLSLVAVAAAVAAILYVP